MIDNPEFGSYIGITCIDSQRAAHFGLTQLANQLRWFFRLCLGELIAMFAPQAHRLSAWRNDPRGAWFDSTEVRRDVSGLRFGGAGVPTKRGPGESSITSRVMTAKSPMQARRAPPCTPSSVVRAPASRDVGGHRDWHTHGQNLVVLAVPDERALESLLEQMRTGGGFTCAPFHEPDFGGELTAFAVGDEAARLLSSLPLALRPARAKAA